MKSTLWHCSLAGTLAMVIALAFWPSALISAAEKKGPSANEKLDAATKKYGTGEPTYRLVYKFAPGEEFRTKVTHLATVDTKVKGVEETMKSRSVSSKLWKIQKVDREGNITFTHLVEWVEMWKSVTGRPESKYDSRTDKEVPPDYDAVAKSVGVPLATITIDPIGRVVNRESNQPAMASSIGDLAVPFPAQAVKVGDSWHTPQDVPLREEDGRIRNVQVRQRYTLEKVETGVATIQIKTQVLTPVNDPKLEAQLVQRLQSGTAKFDLQEGRIIHRQMDLDETVVSFAGPESNMQYLARYTEEQIKPAVAARPGSTKK